MNDNPWLLALRYTSLRLALFAVPFLLLLFTPLALIIDVAVALVLSAGASMFVGRPLRDRMAAAWQRRGPSSAR